MDDLFSDAVRQLLTDQCTANQVRAIEAGQPAAALWQMIEDAGFADALVSSAQGGAGLSLAEVCPVLMLCGSFALPVPLGETMLARALLAQAGVAIPAGSITFGSALPGAEGGLVCANLPSARVADWALLTTPTGCLLLPLGSAQMSAAAFCLDARSDWLAAVVAAGLPVASNHDPRLLQACLSAAQLAGALLAVFERTLQYANSRHQFGRPIGKFQAIQHQLSVISEHAFAARMAAQIGCQSNSAMPERLRVAVAKARCSEAALEVAAISHSIHGAIGFTAEFDLQLYTRRLHLWRQAGGSESYWHDVLGAELVDQQSGLALDLIRSTTDF